MGIIFEHSVLSHIAEQNHVFDVIHDLQDGVLRVRIAFRCVSFGRINQTPLHVVQVDAVSL